MNLKKLQSEFALNQILRLFSALLRDDDSPCQEEKPALSLTNPQTKLWQGRNSVSQNAKSWSRNQRHPFLALDHRCLRQKNLNAAWLNAL
jgi:hypothetical protein